MKASASYLALALAVAGAATVSCKDKGAGKGDAAAASSASSAAGAAASGSAAAATPAATAELSLEDFVGKVAPTTCKMLEQCKNDKVKATVTTTVMMVAGFGSMDKPELAKEVSAVGKTMKAEKRWLPNEAECATTGNVALKVVGMNETLKARVGKSVAYDGKKAASCIASIANAPDACKTEVKLATEPKFKEIDTFSKELHDPLEAYGKPCEDVVSGLVEAGAACEYDLECKGKDTKCGKGKTPKAKTCQPKPAKK
ncbi:MAG TPA: hypothetical protein VLT33_26185 [Labilithrix sp.]|nr:hypothetical protein [Labilithrix sp.]